MDAQRADARAVVPGHNAVGEHVSFVHFVVVFTGFGPWQDILLANRCLGLASNSVRGLLASSNRSHVNKKVKRALVTITKKTALKMANDKQSEAKSRGPRS